MSFKANYKNYIRMAIFFILYCVVMFTDLQIYLFEPLANMMGKTKDGYQAYVILVNVILYCFLIVCSFFLVPDIYYVDFKIFQKKSKKRRWLELLIGYGVFYSLSIMGSILSTFLGGATDSVNEQTINAILVSKTAWIYIPVVVVVGPIVEEIAFRGILQSTIIGSKFQDRHNPRVFIGIMVSSLLFGFLHVSTAKDYVQIFPYLFMGLGLGVVTYATKSIYPSIIIHILNNLMSVLLTLLFSGILLK